MTAPLSPAEQATVDRFANTPHAPESLRMRVAEAINEVGAWCGDCDFEDGIAACAGCRRVCVMYADAAIAVITGAAA